MVQGRGPYVGQWSNIYADIKHSIVPGTFSRRWNIPTPVSPGNCQILSILNRVLGQWIYKVGLLGKDSEDSEGSENSEDSGEDPVEPRASLFVAEHRLDRDRDLTRSPVTSHRTRAEEYAMGKAVDKEDTKWEPREVL